MSLKMYGLDRYAHELVAEFCPKGVLNETHDMRTTAALGLERFFGEHLRLGDKPEGDYWRKTWDRFVKIMDDSGIKVPTLDETASTNSTTIRQVVNDLWDEEKFPTAHRKVALAVLIQLCDDMVWWAQRYKKFSPQKT
ncbi:MAG: hypothetical protein IGS54_16935 [Elainella sp. C42_A2020_010]|nr:hypothetical protein [Elainella sp. C42_A2020_010]